MTHETQKWLAIQNLSNTYIKNKNTEKFWCFDRTAWLLLTFLAGTIWLQQILSLIEVKGDAIAINDQLTSERIPWIELIGSEEKFVSAPSPRIRVTHLQYKFMPLGLKKKKGKVGAAVAIKNKKVIIYLNLSFHSSSCRSSMWPEIQRMFWCPIIIFTNLQPCWRPQKTLTRFLRSSWREMVGLFFNLNANFN